jgi:hypothetical protein
MHQQPLIGVLFVLIAASVSPRSIEDVLPEAIALFCDGVLLRPVVVVPTGGLHFRGSEASCLDGPRESSRGDCIRFGSSPEDGIAGANPAADRLRRFATAVLYGLRSVLARAPRCGKQRDCAAVGGHDGRDYSCL